MFLKLAVQGMLSHRGQYSSMEIWALLTAFTSAEALLQDSER